MLHIVISPDFNARRLGAPASGAKARAIGATVIAALNGGFKEPTGGICTRSDGNGLLLDPSWFAVQGAESVTTAFGQSMSWTRQSPLGSTGSGSSLGYYKLSFDLPLTIHT